MAKIPIAIQLFSIREDCARDLPGTLEAVANMGYDGVEFAGYHGRSANELRKMLDDLKLKVAGTHLWIETLLGDEFDKTIEFNRILGNKFLIVPAFPEDKRKSKSGWLEMAQIMNEIAVKLRPEGMRVGYHNHAIEFQQLEGEMPWDTFFGATVRDVVMQLDTGNAIGGGLTPDGILAIIKKYPGRANTIHLREFSSTNDRAIIGEGDIKWKELFSLCQTIGGTEWYVVEQGSKTLPPLECARRCIQNLRKML